MKIELTDNRMEFYDDRGRLYASFFDTGNGYECGGKDFMTNEEIRNEINEATRDFGETTRKVNEALNHAAGRLDKAEKEAYDRGLNDCWEMMKRIHLTPIDYDNALYPKDLDKIFGDRIPPLTYTATVLLNYTPQQALAKIRAWEEKKAEEECKKQEEAEKIQIGDVVEVYIKEETTTGHKIDVWTGVVLNNSDHSIYYLRSNGEIYAIEYDKNVRVRKTGKHVDILGALKE